MSIGGLDVQNGDLMTAVQVLSAVTMSIALHHVVGVGRFSDP